MTEHDNADEVTRLRAEVARLKRNTAGLYERTHAAEAALTRVRAALDTPSNHADWCASYCHGDCCQAECDCHVSTFRAALDSASLTTRPSPAPADDEGTGTAAAPSEGHSEAQGAPIHEGMPCPLVNPPRPGARTWPCCAHCPKGCAAEGWHLVDCGEGCALEPNRWQ